MRTSKWVGYSVRDLTVTGCASPARLASRRAGNEHQQRTSEHGELDLVTRARGGELDAFNDLVRRYERKIYRLAKNITQNDEDAEDVLQETFLKAYEHLGDFQGNSKFYTWLVRIAVNEALMKLRKRKSDRTVPLDEPVDTGEETVVREIAVWDEDPEQKFSQEELGRNSYRRRSKPKTSFPNRFCSSRHRRIKYRGNGASFEYFDSRREEPPAAGSATTSGEAHALLQTQGRRRFCLLVRNFCKS